MGDHSTDFVGEHKECVVKPIDGFSGHEHSLPIMPLYSDVAQLVAKTNTFYTPTLLVNYGGIIAEEYFYATTEVHDDKKLNRFYPHNVLDDYTRRRRVWAAAADVAAASGAHPITDRLSAAPP